jgi:hypothetical protein
LYSGSSGWRSLSRGQDFSLGTLDCCGSGVSRRHKLVYLEAPQGSKLGFILNILRGQVLSGLALFASGSPTVLWAKAPKFMVPVYHNTIDRSPQHPTFIMFSTRKPDWRWFEASPVKCYCMRCFLRGEVSELADEHDLGSCAERRGGSSPPFPTNGYDR